MGLLESLGLQATVAAPAQRDERGPPPGAGDRTARGETTALPALGQPQLLSITIEPEVTTIDAETRLQLRAFGHYDDQASMEITIGLDWDSSDRSAIEVDLNGVATALPVTGKAVITATDEDSGVSASIELEVRFRPMLGPDPLPALKRIEVRPERAELHVTDVLALQATGVYADDSRRAITNAVEWRSSEQKVLGFSPPLLPGSAYAFTAGRASVTAFDAAAKVTSPAVAVKVTVKKAPPPPPKRLETVEVSSTRKATDAWWVVGETFAYKAVGVFSDKSRVDVTKAVVWQSRTPKFVSLGPDGAVKVLSPGAAVLFAGMDRLRLASSADRYVYATVLGAPPKPPVPGALTRKAAEALIQNLVELAKYRHDSDAPGPGIRAKPTGDGKLDAVLALVADVVNKWGGEATILQARQIWAAVRPRLLALLKEAAGPKLGLSDKELNPARNAVNDMDAWVQKPPGGRVLEQRYVHKVTPFGELSFLYEFIRSDGGHYGPDDVNAFLEEYEEARSVRSQLVKRMRTLEDHGKHLQKTAGDAAALQREVKARATKHAQQEDKHYQSALRDIKIVQVILNSFTSRLSDAKAQVSIAVTQLDAANLGQQASELRKLAEEQGKGLDLGLGIIKLGVSVMVLKGPAAVMGVFDVVKDLRKLFGTSLGERAAELERRAQGLNVEHARAALAQARVNVDEAMKLLKEAEDLKGEFGDDLELTRAEAEHAYDRNARSFRFDDVRKAIEAADQAEQTGDDATLRSRRARNAAGYFSREVDFAKRPRFEGNNVAILQAIEKDASAMHQASTTDVQRIAALRSDWRALRSTAHRALFTSQDPRKKTPVKAT